MEQIPLVVIAMIVVVVDLKLWNMQGRVPIFPAGGDASYYLATVKDVVSDHGERR